MFEVSPRPEAPVPDVDGHACSDRIANLSGMELRTLVSALLDRSPFAQYLVTCEGTIATWNAAAEGLLGYTADEIIGKSSSVLMPSHFLALWRQAKERIGRDGVVNIDSVRRHRDGHLVDVGVTAVCIGATENSLPSYLIVLQDKRRQREVERENERLAAFVRHSPQAIVGVDPDGTIQSWNAAAEVLFGFSPCEAIGRSIDIIIPEQLRAEAATQMSRVAEGVKLEIETIRRARDGKVIPVSISSAPIVNSSGAVTGWANFYKDITQLLEAQRTLRESEAFSRSLIEASPDWISVLDAGGRVIYENRMVAGEASAAPSMSDRPAWLEMWPAHQAPALAKCLDEAAVAGRARINAMRCPAGGKRWYDVQLTRLPASGDHRCLLVNARDITDKKASDDHIAMVNKELSHRAKNLLTVIMAMARHTAAQAVSVDQFTEAFYARLYGLARCHDLLVHQNWFGADLHGLVRQQLKPFLDVDSHRLELLGENIVLPPAAAQCLGMALHELATNSVKYGSISSPQGRIRVSCTPQDADYAIVWTEAGGPAVSPPPRRGFGATVIEQMVGECFDREAHLAFKPTGVEWQVSVPRSALAAGA
ncbi:MAG: PAS domain S-box protein [Hyphomicrobiaceae bacterium]|nr:PAS domain S-box protein [Hyphomicrobiaceae bacterium]